MCKPILLIGMMGCGKSTIGRLLAGRMGLPLIDLDEEIARAAGRSIPDICMKRRLICNSTIACRPEKRRRCWKSC